MIEFLLIFGWLAIGFFSLLLFCLWDEKKITRADFKMAIKSSLAGPLVLLICIYFMLEINDSDKNDVIFSLKEKKGK